MKATKFILEPGWKVFLKDSEINQREILKRAGLPGDLFNRQEVSLSTQDYFRLWNSIEKTANDPDFIFNIPSRTPVESFHPAFFAALCCPNLNIALKRLSKFKCLISPITLDITENNETTTATVDCQDKEYPIPPSLIIAELIYIVNIVRIATREEIKPVAIFSSVENINTENFIKYMGIRAINSDVNSISFSEPDAMHPFITENENMWNFFEPNLRKRLTDLTSEKTFAEKVQAILLELLPSGESNIDEVARKLLISKRTLQRRLKEEATNFQNELNKTRKRLAEYYLGNPELSYAQISFLLGFDQPTSFYRAFHEWTGKTPKQMRSDIITRSMPQ